MLFIVMDEVFTRNYLFGFIKSAAAHPDKMNLRSIAQPYKKTRACQASSKVLYTE